MSGSLPDQSGTGFAQQQAFRASQQDVASERVFGHIVDPDQVAGLLKLRAPRQPAGGLEADRIQDDGLAVAREDPQTPGRVQEQRMDIIRVQDPVDFLPAFGEFLPGFTVDDEYARTARSDDQGSIGRDLDHTPDIRVHGRLRIPVQVEMGEGGVLGVQDVQAGRRSDPLGAPAVFDHVDDGGTGQAVRAFPVMLVGFEPHPVEADQSAFSTDPYIIGPVLVDPVHLRVGEAGFRQIQAGVLTRRRQKCAPEEHGRKQKTSHCHFWFICYKNTNSFCPASAMVQKRQLLLHRTVSNDCKDDTFAKTQEDQPNNQL